MDTNTIIGVLSGSLGTILITKIVDYFSAKTAFRRELKRQFFTKKLEIADSAIRFFVSANDTYSELQCSFNLLMNGENKDYAMFLFDNALKKVNQLKDSEHAQLNALSLYFNLHTSKEYTTDDPNIIVNLISKLETESQLAQQKTLFELNEFVY
jgi:hypothetical protein